MRNFSAIQLICLSRSVLPLIQFGLCNLLLVMLHSIIKVPSAKLQNFQKVRAKFTKIASGSNSFLTQFTKFNRRFNWSYLALKNHLIKLPQCDFQADCIAHLNYSLCLIKVSLIVKLNYLVSRC